ncbi:MAG: hemolysin family protein [Treponema sp.]|nr:hemolysin family protein [Treponema sp.]
MDNAFLIGLCVCSAVLIVLSMLFSISESAFLSMNKLRLMILRKERNPRAVRAGKLLEKKELLINTLLVANELVNILLSSIITAVAMTLFGNSGVGIATFVVTICLLIFGEITPKAVSTRNPDKIAYALAFFVDVVMHLLYPFVLIFTLISRIILKIRGINVDKPAQTYSEEDIKSFLDIGEEAGVLENAEKNMMSSVFKFNDLNAAEIMVPRTMIVTLSENASYDEVIETAQRTRFSRFPIYRNSIDDIVGILYLKDLLKTTPKEFSVKKIMRFPLFIPGTRKITSVQQVMQENRHSMAIIIDEYSGTDGLITQSDIHREIFGTAVNRTPWGGEFNIVDLEKASSFELDGATLLIDLKLHLGIALDSAVNDTLGGWIMERLDRIAVPGDRVKTDVWNFTVIKVEKRRIISVKVEKIDGIKRER